MFFLQYSCRRDHLALGLVHGSDQSRNTPRIHPVEPVLQNAPEMLKIVLKSHKSEQSLAVELRFCSWWFNFLNPR
jgi:hypothetical protein